MTRCNSCPLYGLNPECEGNLPPNQCASMLQDKVRDLQIENQRLREQITKMPVPYVVNQFKQKVDEALDMLMPPEKPACHPKGVWNHSIYGYDGNRVIYVDGKAVKIDEATYIHLEHYAKAYQKYERKLLDIKAGIGIHEAEICPVCGEPLTFDHDAPFFAALHSRSVRDWHCAKCGCSGRAVHTATIEKITGVVDGFGRELRVDPADIDGFSCPCCERNLTADEVHLDGKDVVFRCGGSIGLNGCLATGKFVVNRQFRHHIDVHAADGSLLWDTCLI